MTVVDIEDDSSTINNLMIEETNNSINNSSEINGWKNAYLVIFFDMILGSTLMGSLAAHIYMWSGYILAWNLTGIIFGIVMGGVMGVSIGFLIGFKEKSLRWIDGWSADGEQLYNYGVYGRLLFYEPFYGAVWGIMLGIPYMQFIDKGRTRGGFDIIYWFPLTIVLAVLVGLISEIFKGKRRIISYQVNHSSMFMSVVGVWFGMIGSPTPVGGAIGAIIGVCIALSFYLTKILFLIPA